MRGLIRIIAYLNIWVAVSTGFLTYQTYLVFHIPTDWSYLLVVFFSTLFTYNFQRLIKHKRLTSIVPSERHEWISNHFGLLSGVAFISLIFALLFALTIGFRSLFLLGITGIISLLYTGFSTNKHSGLREIPMMKIIWISIVWSIATVFIPLEENHEYVNKDLLWMLHQFLFVLVLCIPFDIRDLPYDPKHLKTLPQMLGIKKSVAAGELLLIIMVLISYEFFGSDLFFIGNGITMFITGTVLILSVKPRKELYYLFLVDGLMIVQTILFALFNH